MPINMFHVEFWDLFRWRISKMLRKVTKTSYRRDKITICKSNLHNFTPIERGRKYVNVHLIYLNL